MYSEMQNGAGEFDSENVDGSKMPIDAEMMDPAFGNIGSSCMDGNAYPSCVSVLSGFFYFGK